MRPYDLIPLLAAGALLIAFTWLGVLLFRRQR